MSVQSSMLSDGVGLLEVKATLLGGNEISELRNAIDSMIRRDVKKLIIDVAKVTFLNSSAVGILVSALISYSRRDWQIRLSGQNKVVYTILKITKLNLAFEYYDTVEEAVGSFA